MSIPRKIRCTIESITDHGGRVYAVDLTPEGAVPSFRPGQFLHLTVDDYDPSGFWPESRVFSIASSPRDRSRIRICYSVKGCYTTKMEQVLKAGREVWIKMPYGEFVIDDSSESVLIAGGTGISAFTAFLEAMPPESQRQVTLVYGARNPGLFLFNERIQSQLAAVPNFKVMFFTETADDCFSRQMAALSKAPGCFTGRISLDMVFRHLSSDIRPLTSAVRPPSSTQFYLSGPPAMLSALGPGLRARGIQAEQIRTDAWE